MDGKRCNFDGLDTLRCCSRSGFVWQPWFTIELENTYNVKQVNLKTFTEEGAPLVLLLIQLNFHSLSIEGRRNPRW